MKILEIKPDKRSFETALSLLQHIPNGMKFAVWQAIKKSLVAGRKVASMRVGKVYRIKAKEIKGQMALKVRSNSQEVVGSLAAKGSALPVRLFHVNPNSDTTGNRRQLIRVAVRKDSRPKPLATGFVSSRWQGNVYIRQKGERRPKAVYTVSVPQMLGNEGVSEAIIERIDEMFHKTLHHEVDYRLQKGQA